MLFDKPLAELLRPQNINEFIGQEELIHQNSLLYNMITKDQYFSFIIWGPPGCGKTSLINIIKNTTKNVVHFFSAVTAGIKDIKEIMKENENNLLKNKIIIFIDEIHRFNKAQQDAFLSYIENGSIILIGLTTENPSFSIINPLLSRLKIFKFSELSYENLLFLLEKGKDYIEKHKKIKINIDEDSKKSIIRYSYGDSRKLLNLLEILIFSKISNLDSNRKSNSISSNSIFSNDENDKSLTLTILPTDIEKIIKTESFYYDKSNDFHYDYLSALHKSMRNSDVDASIYYAVKMLESGEDPMAILRRIIQCSSEDIGLADPQALVQANNALIAYEKLGLPEATLPILQAVVYNALSPKSNSLYIALEKVKEDIKKYPDLKVPYHLRNASTLLLKELGYGKDYIYAHNLDIPIAKMDCLPEELKGKEYYTPKNFGFEITLKKRLDNIKKIKSQK